MTSFLTDADRVLLPHLNRSTGDRALLAALVRGLALGYTPRQIAAVARRHAPELDITSPNWQRLVSAARARLSLVAAAGGGAGKIRLRIARRIGGHLLDPGTPPGLGPRSEAAARIAFGVVAGIFAREAEARGFDTIILTSAYLAARLGVSQRQAVRSLKILRGLGWISAAPKAAGGAARYRLGRLSHAEGEAAWHFGDTVDALATGAPGDPLAEAINSALNPAWAYGLGGRAWLALVAERAGLGGLGLSRPLRKRARAEIQKFLPGVWEGTVPLAPTLDLYAAAAGVPARVEAAEAVLAAAAEAHRVQLAGLMARRAAQSAERARGRAVLKTAWARVGSPPGPGSEAKLLAWGAAAAELFATHPLPGGLAEVVREVLVSQLAWHRHSTPEAQRIAARLLPPRT